MDIIALASIVFKIVYGYFATAADARADFLRRIGAAAKGKSIPSALSDQENSLHSDCDR